MRRERIVRQLHLVGFTSDHAGLILAGRRGAKTGGYVVALEDELLEQIETARRLQRGDVDDDSHDEVGNRSRTESALSPREMQTRIRAGRSVADVAAEAGVDLEWVERFAAPVLAEQMAAVAKAGELTLRTPRRGDSDRPLLASVLRNLADRGVRMAEDELAGAWSANHLLNGEWIIRFVFTSRGRRQQAEWTLDTTEGTLVSRNRLGTELGFVDPGRRASFVRELPPPRRARTGEQSGSAAMDGDALEQPVRRRRRRRRVAQKTTAKKVTARKATAKKSTAKKAAPAAPRKAAARKTVARKPAGRKATTKKSTAKRATAKKVTAKKVTANRTFTANRTVTAKRATARKAAAKKATVKRAATKRAVPAKRPAKKVTALKKAVRKRAAAPKKATTVKKAARKKTAAKRLAPIKRATTKRTATTRATTTRKKATVKTAPAKRRPVQRTAPAPIGLHSASNRAPATSTNGAPEMSQTNGRPRLNRPLRARPLPRPGMPLPDSPARPLRARPLRAKRLTTLGSDAAAPTIRAQRAVDRFLSTAENPPIGENQYPAEY